MKNKLREKYLPMSYEQKGAIIHWSKPNSISTLGHKPSTSQGSHSQPTPTAPFEPRDDIAEDDPEPTVDCKEEVYEAKIDLVDKYEGEDYEEYNIATDRTLFEKILEEDKVIEPSPETQKRKETSADMVPSIQYT